ncbi:MAG: patatin-like phospholipase family protein, partial [Muribaculaceae bacterium]|nr:patatin-like phospholipase family protein [Muribaculaceae bacterium]
EQNINPIIQQDYKLGLALSGGGARGFAHLGAIRAIEEVGLKPDIVAGVSAGSVIAVLYGAGISVDDIMSAFTDRKFSDFANVNLRINANQGLFDFSKFKNFIAEMVAPYVNLEDLPIPTFVGVTDFDHGVPTEFHNGNIADAVAASCSIPICFRPQIINGVSYVDGGVLRNMPSWIIRSRCQRLIGVNCSPLLSTDTSNDSLLEIAMRAYNLMAKANQAFDMDMCDLAVETLQLANYKVFNLKEINKVFISGYATMKKALKEVDWLSELQAENK